MRPGKGGVLTGWALTHTDTGLALPRLQQNSPDHPKPNPAAGAGSREPLCTHNSLAQPGRGGGALPGRLWGRVQACTESPTAGSFTFRCTNTNLSQENIPRGSPNRVTKHTIMAASVVL